MQTLNTFTIKIKGMAICYFADPVWKVLFPFDGDHQVLYTGPNADAVSLAGRRRRIDITPINASIAARPGTGYDLVLNLNAQYAHDGALQLLGNINDLDVVELTITDSAVFSVSELTKCRYQLRNTKTKDLDKDPATIAYSGEFTVVSERLSVSLGTQPPSSPPELHSDTTLIFDNNCQRPPGTCPPDFPMVYRIFKDDGDKDDSQLRFDVERDPVQVSKSDVSISHDRDNPGPLEAGVPCHILSSDPPPENP